MPSEQARRANAERQARHRKRRRAKLVWSPDHQALINPKPHEPSDVEYKRGCCCRGCRDEHALYNRWHGMRSAETGPLELGRLDSESLAVLARPHLDRIEAVPPPPPTRPRMTSRGQHRAS